MARNDDTTTELERNGSARRYGVERDTDARTEGRDRETREERDTSRSRSRSGRHEHRTAKIVELVCSSSRSFEAAIENGLEDARQSTRGISGADVVHMSIQCEDGRPVAYKVNLKLSFGVERDGE